MKKEICILETGEIISIKIKKIINGIVFSVNNAYLQTEILEEW